MISEMDPRPLAAPSDSSEAAPAKKRPRHEFDDDPNEQLQQKTADSEFVDYLSFLSEEDDVIEFWKKYEMRWPRIAKVAKRVLSLPASSASAERVFSSLKLIATDDRFHLLDDTVMKQMIGSSLSNYCEF